ncbi:hypothetical protein, partial [Aureivirga marina]|uniref:hypothetical protein n=1 Tax=Aureivirga marina TaxID=1182451 RepID=UPI0018CA28AD
MKKIVLAAFSFFAFTFSMNGQQSSDEREIEVTLNVEVNNDQDQTGAVGIGNIDTDKWAQLRYRTYSPNTRVNGLGFYYYNSNAFTIINEEGDNTSAIVLGDAGVGNTNHHHTLFGVSSSVGTVWTPRFEIDTNGKVGIGMNGQDLNDLLEVNGQIRAKEVLV